MKSSLFKRIFSDKVSTSLIIAILLLILMRVFILPLSPPGFFKDEAASQAHVVTMVANHTNTAGQSWPLFSQSLGGGFTTPVYLYPLSAWALIFGSSDISLRAFSQFVTVIAILFVALGMRLWLGRRSGLIALVVGLALPWNWLQGSIAWDPVMTPLMASIAFFGFSLLMTRTTHKPRLIGMFLLPTSLVLMAYSYPPYWVSAPILYLAAYLTLYFKKHISIKSIILSCIAAAVLAIPLLLFILQPGTLDRTSNIGVFSNTTIFGGIGLFIKNILLLINPIFLFIYGDSNNRHSVGIQGMLGIAALIPIIVLAWSVIKKYFQNKSTLFEKNELTLLAIGICGFIISLIGSALTNEGQPHSLRSCGAWPFAIILITIGWNLILRQQKLWLKRTALTLFIIATLAYAIDLAYFFPSRSANDFDAPKQTTFLSK